MLNNREWAILIWTAVVLGWGLTHKDVRSSMLGVIRSFLHPKILIPFFAMFTYIWAEIWLGSRLALWHHGLAKDTVVWAITSGVVMFFNYDDAAKKPKFFRRRLLKAFEITVFIEVLTSLFVMNIFIEIALQPIIVFLAVASVMAGYNDDFLVLKKPANIMLAMFGLFAILFSFTHLVTHWATIDKGDLLRQFLLPVWLTIGELPFVYLLSLYANYELAFLRINWAEKNRRKSLSAKLALAMALNVQTYKIEKFTGGWPTQLLEAKGFKARRKVIKRYISEQKHIQ